MNQRLTYIDQLKGFAMFLVVMGHISLFNLRLGDESVLFRFCYSIELPLFSFLSGLMFKMVEERGMVWHKFGRQCKRLLVPFLVLGLPYAFAVGTGGVKFFLLNSKGGYWYLYFLAQCYLLTYLFELTLGRIAKRRRFLMEAGWTACLTLLFLVLDHFDVVMNHVAPLSAPRVNPVAAMLRDLVGFPNLFYYYGFFMMGYVVRKYNLFERIFEDDRIGKLACVAYLVFFVLSYRLPILSKLHLVAIPGCVGFVYVFYKMRHANSRVQDGLALWGRHSLQIYVFHYYMVGWCAMPAVGEYFLHNRADFLQVLLELALASVMCQLCVYIHRLLRNFTTLI